MRPRKYFWATMLVAFCDQLFGNSTPRCSNAGLSGSPIRASRISHSTASNGLTPASVKRLPTLTPSPAAVMAGAVALRLSDMTSPRVGDLLGLPQGGTTDTAPRVGRTPNRPPGAADRRRGGGRPGSAGPSRPPRRGRPDCGKRTRTGSPTPGRAGRARARRDRRSGSPRPRGRSASPPPRSTPTAASSCSELTGRLLAARSSPPRSFWLSNRSRRPSRLRTVTFVSVPLVRGEAVAAALALATAADGIARLARLDTRVDSDPQYGQCTQVILLPVVLDSSRSTTYCVLYAG